MSNAEDLLKPGTFDIRNIVSERQLPEDAVHFYVNEKVGYQIKKLDQTIRKLNDQLGFLKDEKQIEEAKDALATAQNAYDELGEQIKGQRYTANIRTITRRNKRDIQSKALAEWPIQRDMWGRDNSTQEFERGEYLQTAAWEACILSIESPDGQIQKVNGTEDAHSIVVSLRGDLPESANTAIDAALAQLDDDGEWWNAAAQNQDF
jgi:hypothetical protein